MPHKDDFALWEAEMDEDNIPDIPRTPFTNRPTHW